MILCQQTAYEACVQASIKAATMNEPPTGPFAAVRAAMRWVLAAFFVAVGIAHLVVQGTLLTITPAWVPFAPQVIFVTGLCELAGAAALVTRPLRHWAGMALALYSLCVWPANIKQALDGIAVPHIPDSWWYHGPRLAMQPVIIWAALFSAGVIDWPFAALRRRGTQRRPPQA
jgi:uncharacterized membrane protein